MKYLIALISALGFAAEPGQTKFGSEHIESVEGVGVIQLNGTTVEKEARITGNLIAQNAKLGSLDVTGAVNLTGTTIKNSSYVMGSLQAIRSSFEKPIIILSQKALFTASKLDAITVRQDAGFKGKQVIELRQGTVVNGPIHFESGKGEVLVYPGCQALGGVTGGKIVRRS